MRRLLPLLFFAVGIAGCSSSEPGGTTTTTAPADLVVSAIEWRFIPATVDVTAGDEFTVEMRNDGTVIHNWTVLSERVETESDFRPEMAIAAVEAEAGAKATTTFTVPAAGEYQIICTIPGHFSSGMEGTLSVTG